MLEVIITAPYKNITINSSIPHENHGDYYALFCGRYMDHSIYRSLLQFNLPTILNSGVIESAEIMLYINRNDYPYPKEFRIYRLADEFNEDINYLNQPTIDMDLYKSFIVGDEVNTWFKIDITEIFNEWYQGKYQNNGVMITSADESINSLVGFQSKDSEERGYTPKLQITFRKSHQKENMIKTKAEEILTPEVSYNKGNIFFEKQEYKNAYKYYSMSFENFNAEKSYSPKLLFRLIQTMGKLEIEDKALELIDKGVKYYPLFTDLIFLKAKLLHGLNKTSLAIKSLKECIDIGESPLQLSFITGIGSYRSYYELAKIYLDMEDYDESYHWCLEAIKTNPKFQYPLYMIAKILTNKGRDYYDIQTKLESILGSNLEGRECITMADIFMEEKKYDLATEYIIKSEKFMPLSPKLFYMKGLCFLYEKEYQEAYNSFIKIRRGELYNSAIFNMVLCQILNNNMKNAKDIITKIKAPEMNNKRVVLYSLKSLVENKECTAIASTKEESKQYVDIIFDTLDILLGASTPEIFEKALNLLNLVESDEVLLRLAKLYYNHGFHDMAYQEFIRSIKFFGKVDMKGLNMMKKTYGKNQS